MTVLRPYQTLAIKQLLHAVQRGVKRVILQMATGSGKTAVFCQILKSTYSKGNRGIMVVRGAKLVHQASGRLAREGVPHGIFQAQKTRGADKRMLVCSIDTLYARKIAPPADVIIVDEAHLSSGEAYKWLLSQPRYADAVVIGVTATPFAKDGLEHVGEEIVHPVTIKALIDDGYLVGGEYYVPYIPDLKGVKSNKSDYITKQLQGALDQDKTRIYGHLRTQWETHGRGKKSLVFCVSVAHAKSVQAEMIAFGAIVEHVDASLSFDERDRIIDRLEKGEIDAITSVGCLTTGVDIPSLEVIFMMRPTKSYNLWIQMLGRGTRPFPGKEKFKLVDLSGNLHKFGPIEAEMRGQIEPTKGDPTSPKIYTCSNCFNAVTVETCEIRNGPYNCIFKDREQEHRFCPACGTHMCLEFYKPRGERSGPENDDEVEIEKYEIQPWEYRFPILVDIAKHRGWKKGWVAKSIEREYGEDAVAQAWPRIRALRKWPLKDRLGNIRS